MKSYFGYIRVSTVKQGEKGSSLGEQRAAIEAYARRHGLLISEWYEELETAAKQGRPIFMRMLKGLRAGEARGVVTHKIDRSARNLKDWAMLGDLIDSGVEMHFAHESIDLTSRGGRLSADIQAVVAADYIRNLRDEVRKGFYGRLKQGLYPLKAPIGYLDRGGGQPKTIDPVRGPLVAKAFELYATGAWSLDTLQKELYDRGLRTKAGRRVSRNGFSTILNNTFYVGIIRIATTNEAYQGVHEPLIDKRLFDRVQAILKGRITHRQWHRYRYQRLLRCALCGYSLVAELKKGRVYYRCHTRSCSMKTIREDRIDEVLRRHALEFRLDDDDCREIRDDIEAALAHKKADIADERKTLSLSLAALDERLARLTDAYVDQLIEREIYLARKESLLGERAEISSRISALEVGGDPFRERADRILELIKSLGNMPLFDSDEDLRDLLKNTTSNLAISPESLTIAWQNPFAYLFSGESVASGGPHRIKHRTNSARIRKILIDYIQEDSPVKVTVPKKQKRRPASPRSRSSRLSSTRRQASRRRDAA